MTRIDVLGVPVDVCPPEDMEKELLQILEKPGTKQIIFLTIWDLLRARNKKKDFSECVKNADLIIPISKSIVSGARFLKRKVPVRYNPFNATIQILSILDQHYKSLYMLGSHKKTLMTAARNVHDTFPNLHLVGRFVGYYPKASEASVIEAIHKSSPSLAIIADGIKEKNLWAYHRKDKFSSSIFLYYRDCFGIFAERVKRVNERTFEKGHEIWHEIARNPFKLFLVFPFFCYIMSLVWSRILKK